MTGYLQRMALSAMKPGGSTLRPMVGSIYSAPKSRAALEPGLVGQDILSARPDELNSRPVSVSPSPFTAPPTAPADTMAAPREESSPPIVERDEQGPRSSHAKAEPDLVPGNLRFQGDADTERLARRFSVRRDSKPVERLPLRGEAILPEGSKISKDEAGEMRTANNNRGQEGTSIDRPFVPMVAEDHPAGFDNSPRLGGRRERTAASKTPGATLREPDEIQIHIGRIEVTAVQAPPARPSPQKAARKAPSLGEYLKRGNGRIP